MGDTQELFNLMHDEHGLTLLQNEMQLIIETCKQYLIADSETGANVPLVMELCPFCDGKMKVEPVMNSYVPMCEDKSCVAGEEGYWAATIEEAIIISNKRAS